MSLINYCTKGIHINTHIYNNIFFILYVYGKMVRLGGLGRQDGRLFKIGLTIPSGFKTRKNPSLFACFGEPGRVGPLIGRLTWQSYMYINTVFGSKYLDPRKKKIHTLELFLFFFFFANVAKLQNIDLTDARLSPNISGGRCLIVYTKERTTNRNPGQIYENKNSKPLGCPPFWKT